MNPVFWLLILIGLILLWFIISFAFIPLGRLLLKKWNKTIEILNKEIEKENKGKKEKE